MLRPLFLSDLDQVLTIEEAVHVAPWTRETFLICFQSGYLGWVVEIDKKIVGFIIVSIRVEECHILNVCVARAYQRQGFGRKLIEEALKYAKDHGVGIAYLEVRRTNTRAIELYKNMHFQCVGERKGYYPMESGNEDALVYAINLRRVD